MGVHLNALALSYFSVPKCACTTLKQFFFEWENGFPFRPFTVQGEMHHLHGLLPCRKFEREMEFTRSNFLKVTVIRDTVSRVVSCYRNRVASWNGNKTNQRRAAEFGAVGLPTAPTVDEFVANIEAYQEASAGVKHHSRPLSFFLGTDPSFFDRIFDVSQINEFVAEVDRRTVHVPMLRRLQNGGADTKVEDLSAESVALIKEKYAEDYELFGSYFKAA